MISYLKGTLESKAEAQVELDVGGVGYCVNVPLSTFQKLPETGARLKLLISESTAMYGGDTSYYGFIATEEKEIFILLKSVSKIGAKAALDILSKVSKSFPDFKEAILKKNTSVLTGLLGLTPKTAEKLILGLKGKIKKLELKGDMKMMVKDEQSLLDAVEGLVSMGYRESEAKEAVSSACVNMPKEPSAESIIRKALKHFKR